MSIKFNKGDKIRRLKEEFNKCGWSWGDQVVTVVGGSFRSVKVDVDGGEFGWDPKLFELVEKCIPFEERLANAKSWIGKKINSPHGVHTVDAVHVQVAITNAWFYHQSINSIVKDKGYAIIFKVDSGYIPVELCSLVPDTVDIDLSTGKATVSIDGVSINCNNTLVLTNSDIAKIEEVRKQLNCR